MYRSTYEAPAEEPSDDEVVLPDALNLPALADATQLAPTLPEPTGAVPPIPTSIAPSARTAPLHPIAPPAAPQPSIASLPSAPPVERERTERALPGRRIVWVAGAALAGVLALVGVLVAGALIIGGGPQTASTARESASFAAGSSLGLTGERGRPITDRTAPPSPAPTPPSTPAPAPEDSAPDDSAPKDSAPVTPPKREEPAPSPRPSVPPASPQPPPATAPTAPAPLAFTGLTENRGPNAIGVEVRLSYTLAMTGEPESSASVRYGWREVGSVTFAPDGSATIDIDRSTLLLIPGNARIRAEYSDGTAGDPIEVRRNDL